MRQKSIIIPLILAIGMIMAVIICSCRADDADSPVLRGSVKVISVSIAPGVSVDPSLKKITLTFNTPITLSPSAAITLNGIAVNAYTPGSVSSTELIIEVVLVRENAYTLRVPSGAVTDSKGRRSEAYTLSFKTASSNEPGEESGETDDPQTVNLIDPDATPAAKALYQLLLDNYGHRILSGVVGSTSWGNGYAEAVAEAAGCYPAIIGFDFIRLFDSATDYADISPVSSVWEAGGVPAITWHWSVPAARNSSQFTCSAGNTDFNPANIAIVGTWENSVAEGDVAKVAATLLKLSSAGIPVLWRPLPEANGDFVWGAWHWWGAKGPETARALWLWLYDRLTNVYGVHNLIWVWTADYTSAGSLADIALARTAYPGHERVDIIGADIFDRSGFGSRADVYSLLNAIGSGSKMLALSECGNLPGPDRSAAESALWSYFIAACEWESDSSPLPIGSLYSTPSEWREVLSNPIVINRGDPRLKTLNNR